MYLSREVVNSSHSSSMYRCLKGTLAHREGRIPKSQLVKNLLRTQFPRNKSTQPPPSPKTCNFTAIWLP